MRRSTKPESVVVSAMPEEKENNGFTSYDRQAIEFLNSTKTSFKAEWLERAKYFHDDKEERNVYRIVLRRQGKTFRFKFGQSINGTENGEVPTVYHVLASLEKFDPGTFDEFCSEYGYDNDSCKAEKTYKGAVKEFAGVNRLFSDVIEKLAEIQ